MRRLENYVRKYGPEFGPVLYHALQSQAAHAGVERPAPSQDRRPHGQGARSPQDGRGDLAAVPGGRPVARERRNHGDRGVSPGRSASESPRGQGGRSGFLHAPDVPASTRSPQGPPGGVTRAPRSTASRRGGTGRSIRWRHAAPVSAPVPGIAAPGYSRGTGVARTRRRDSPLLRADPPQGPETLVRHGDESGALSG